jgi:hypothetical protein
VIEPVENCSGEEMGLEVVDVSGGKVEFPL